MQALMRELEDLFAALGRSAFRSGIALSKADAAYVRRLGLQTVLEHAEAFVRQRLAPARPANDGRQTPWRGHPAFTAQHATATCCRSCLAKWHRIPRGRELSEQQIRYLLCIIRTWLELQSVPQTISASDHSNRPRSILHVDMDAFYASIEERENPALAGRPLIVGGTPQGRGVVAAANYAVRKFGVHSAMPTATALRLCPDAVVLPPRMDYYATVSAQLREIFQRFTPLVEPLSLDEAFLDVTGSVALFGDAQQIGLKIKEEIAQSLRLVASVGAAPNKFLAKVASDLQKPDGFVVVDPDRVQEFLDPLPVRRLWGVGKVAAAILEELGVRTIGDVRRLPLEMLQERFGQQGRHLWELARGIDERPVVADREAKSISHETTFPADVADPECLRAWAVELAEQVARRLRRHKLQGRTISVKVRFSDFRTITRSTTLSRPTSVTGEIEQAVGEILSSRLPAGHLPVRLLGVGVSGFERPAPTQLTLFDSPEPEPSSQDSLDRTADEIRDRFGAAAISRGSSLMHRTRHTPLPRPESPSREA